MHLQGLKRLGHALWCAPRAALMGLVLLYRWLLSAHVGGACRFSPTCSVYALHALRNHGACRGGILSVWRMLRCQPLSAGGCDPVPPRKRPQACSACSCQPTPFVIFDKFIP